MKTRLPFVALVAPLALAGCLNAEDAQRPAEVTAPRRSVSATADTTERLSSVCLSLKAKLQQYRADAAANPGDSEVQEGVEAFQARFTDACE